ncbi:unnamed protein product [Tuber melanosporum]|uniref:(Perigord truffle) hypothetical protein n=1 Tax=Tuber melanosporum (strain Mel28) TaxID=656061 RepID=D5GE19_TUBMM|nr:uncharacterized protein GSTUM_00001183001 [Tuber melanosporum]CAZ82762.1 unnamed protein product [Tuber melanosporum]
MSKRRSESQLTREQFDKMSSNGFNFSANRVGNGVGGGPEDVTDPSMMADRATLSHRKIAPLKRGRGGVRAGARTGGGDNIPNLFSGVAGGVTFGASNGTVQQPQQSFGGFGFGATGNNSSTSTGFGGSSAGGSFEFAANNNNGQQEQSKPNPFASLGASSNGTMFQTAAQPQATSLFGGNSFGSNNASQTSSATPAPSFVFGATNNSSTPAPPATENFNKTPSFTFGSGNTSTPTMFGGTGDSSNNNKSSFTFGTNSGVSGAASPVAAPAAFGSFGSNAGSLAPLFGSTPSPAPVLEKTPEPTPAIAAPQPTFSFGAATPASSSTGNSLFSKPSEPLFKPTPSPEPLASGSLFGAPKPSPSPEPSAASPGLFGSQTTASTGSGGLFNSSAAPVVKPPTFTGFGPPAQPPTPNADEKPPTFSWGPPSEEPKKAEEAPNAPFGGFGAHTIDPQQEAPAPKPFTGFGQGPEEPAKPLFGSSAPSTIGSGLFGKPAENRQDTPAPSTPSLFNRPAETSTPSSFGKPTETKQDTPAVSAGLFGKPTGPSTSNFFGKPAEAKQDTPVTGLKKAPTFEGSPITFGKNSVSAYGGSGISPLSPAPVNQFVPPAPPAPKAAEPTVFSAANVRTPSPPLPSDATSWAPAQLTEYYNLYGLRSLNYRFLEALMKADQFGDWSSACEIYVREASRIKTCQENGERYKGASGGHAKRALTEGEDGGGKRRKEEDSTKRSNFSDSPLGVNAEKKDWQSLSSAPLFGFKPPSLSDAKSSSSSHPAPLPTAPLFGFKPPEGGDGNNLSNGRKLASGPVHGFKPPGALGDKGDKPKTGGSVFDSPSAPVNNSGFVNPFSKVSTDDIVVEEDDDDNVGANKKASSGRSLFDRISEPLTDKKEGGFFGSPKIGFGEPSLLGKKVDDANPNSLFGSVSESASASSTSAATPSLFGTATTSKPEVGFSFGGLNKPAGSISVPPLNPSLLRPTSALSRNSSDGNTTSAVSTPGATETDASEPNDNAHNAKNDLDLSGPGPGEEDEDSKYQMKALVYESTKESFKKTGSGTLRVLKNRENCKARIVVRTDIGKVILNVGLNKLLNYTVVDDKKKNSIRIPEFLPGGSTRTWLVRVKLAEDAARLATVMNEEKL